jgi:hypothetical protein
MDSKIQLLILVLIISVIFVSGCVEQGFTAEQIAKGSKEVKEFLKEYPRATFVASLLDNETVEGIITELRDTCGEQMKVKGYWKVKVQDPDTNVTITAWVDDDTKQTVCIVKAGGLSTETKVKECKAYEKSTDDWFSALGFCDSTEECITILKELLKHDDKDFEDYIAQYSIKCEETNFKTLNILNISCNNADDCHSFFTKDASEEAKSSFLRFKKLVRCNNHLCEFTEGFLRALGFYKPTPYVICTPCFSYFAFADYDEANQNLYIRNGPRNIEIISIIGGSTNYCAVGNLCNAGSEIIIGSVDTSGGPVNVTVSYRDTISGLTHTDTATIRGKGTTSTITTTSSTTTTEKAGITVCSSASFKLYSGSYKKDIKNLFLILENRRAVNLQLENLFLQYQSKLETKILNTTLKGNEIRSLNITGVEDNFISGIIKTNCPAVSVDFTYAQVT